MSENGLTIVSFTTTPSRINHLAQVLNSIYYNQTVKPDYVVLTVPHTFRRTGESYNIPSYLIDLAKHTSWFMIRRADEDLGPITKIYYSMLDYQDPYNRIISIDDDIRYEKHFIEELLVGHQEKPDSIIGFMGNTPEIPYVHSELIQMGNNERAYFKVNVLGGYKGILYPRKYIDDDFFRIVKELMCMHIEKQNTPILEDDNLLGFYFRRKGIDLMVIGTFYPRSLFGNSIYDIVNITFLDTSKVDGLYSEGNGDKMSNSYKIISEYFAEAKSS